MSKVLLRSTACVFAYFLQNCAFALWIHFSHQVFQANGSGIKIAPHDSTCRHFINTVKVQLCILQQIRDGDVTGFYGKMMKDLKKGRGDAQPCTIWQARLVMHLWLSRIRRAQSHLSTGPISNTSFTCQHEIWKLSLSQGRPPKIQVPRV